MPRLEFRTLSASTSSLGSHTISLTQGQLELNGAGAGTITIDGSSPSTPITLTGGPSNSHALLVDSGVQAVVTNLNIESFSGPNDGGGAIKNAGTLAVSNDVFSNNYSSGAGGADREYPRDHLEQRYRSQATTTAAPAERSKTMPEP